MSWFDVYQQGPEVYVPVILLSLAGTVLGYGAFPLIFAKTRKKPITQKKYRWLCYGINLLVMIVFFAIDGGGSGGPYFLWTWVFSSAGIKILKANYTWIDPKAIDYTKTAAGKPVEKVTVEQRPVDGGYLSNNQEIYIDVQKCTNEVLSTEIEGKRTNNSTLPKIAFCRKCGHKLTEGSLFCSSCGAKIEG